MNVGMFEDIKGRNYRVRAMGGERSWCFFHRKDVGSSKENMDLKQDVT